MPLILKHQSEDAFLTRLRERYRNASGEDAVTVAAYVVAAIQRGDLTDASVRAKFGMTVAQWTQAKNRMGNFVSARNTLRSAIGE